ncbi:MAG: T9SS type A sorting domain-containing protein, partial [Bacteroidota bacterium]|nr:T9SS type A sorting domain-containing protein [Bacteroidota bacterium]
YQWYINGTLLNGETDSILTVIINGIYQVEVFDQNNCSSLSNGLLYESVHVNEIENELNLYPTPTNSLLNVFCSVNIMSYQIINSNGQQVLNKNVAFPSKFISIDVSLLSKGLYFIVTHHTKGSSIKKFNSL